MKIYILSHYWDTPDNEGSEIIGAYYSDEDAASRMKSEAAAIKNLYPTDFWEDDSTWEDDREIHLGRCSAIGSLATIYCWEINKVEVQ